MHKLKELAKEDLKDTSKTEKVKYVEPIDDQSFKMVTYIFMGLMFVNLFIFFLPFVDFEGGMTSSDTGYLVITWFNTSFEEGPIIALCITVIFIISIVALSLLIFTLISHGEVTKAIAYKYLKKFNYVYIALVLILLIIVFNMIEVMRFRLSGEIYELPYPGIGLHMLLWVNMIVPILLGFVFKVIRAKNQDNFIP
ncbi:hypothetical protein IY230_06425 [Acholeplasma laidlawii]|uniref:hypothetical protein n=1 Tax=Acholeplasma laidlawii TaxID=2148 RepID=UPI0018C3239F|nr:hypothetical protein [Acholeplasma laidlawii]MBG0763236.1 hypothetical protein [Acholeplasma laidlawii]